MQLPLKCALCTPSSRSHVTKRALDSLLTGECWLSAISLYFFLLEASKDSIKQGASREFFSPEE